MADDNPGKYPEGGSKMPHLHPAACKVTIRDAQAGLVDFAPRLRGKRPTRRTKFAIVGFSGSTRDQAPYGDPEWVIAGLNQLYRFMPRADLWFEIHNRRMFEGDIVRDTDYVGWLQHAP